MKLAIDICYQMCIFPTYGFSTSLVTHSPSLLS